MDLFHINNAMFKFYTNKMVLHYQYFMNFGIFTLPDQRKFVPNDPYTANMDIIYMKINFISYSEQLDGIA